MQPKPLNLRNVQHCVKWTPGKAKYCMPAPLGIMAPISLSREKQSRRKLKQSLQTRVFGRRQHKSVPEKRRVASALQEPAVVSSVSSLPSGSGFVSPFFFSFFSPIPRKDFQSFYSWIQWKNNVYSLHSQFGQSTFLFHKIRHWYIYDSESQAHSLRTVVFQAG